MDRVFAGLPDLLELATIPDFPGDHEKGLYHDSHFSAGFFVGYRKYQATILEEQHRLKYKNYGSETQTEPRKVFPKEKPMPEAYSPGCRPSISISEGPEGKLGLPSGMKAEFCHSLKIPSEPLRINPGSGQMTSGN